MREERFAAFAIQQPWTLPGEAERAAMLSRDYLSS